MSDDQCAYLLSAYFDYENETPIVLLATEADALKALDTIKTEIRDGTQFWPGNAWLVYRMPIVAAMPHGCGSWKPHGDVIATMTQADTYHDEPEATS